MNLFPGLERDVLAWDVLTWRQALQLWEAHLPERLTGFQSLELGAGQGGLSLYLGLKGAEVICSDMRSPEPLARPLHQRYGLEQIQYRALNAQSLDLPDQSLDLVCCKSVLGGVRKQQAIDPKPQMMAEISRVLKPGGWLLLAENLQGHALHRWLRRHFVVWSGGWEYLPQTEWLALLAGFELCAVRSAGVLALVGRSEAQRRWLARLDQLLVPVVPARHHYMFAAVLRKPAVSSVSETRPINFQEN
ncbi:MAG: class I SAM-dependent methyltransferase [Candidatus Sericytochromatia bacterium]